MNIKKILAGAGATALLLGNVAMPALALTFNNGSFETGTANGAYLTVPAGNTDINDWTVDSGSVDYIGTYWQSSDGVKNVDLNGNEQGSISQVLTTVIGATYTVNFDMSGNPDGGPVVKTVHVSATGGVETPYTFNTTGITKEAMNWTQKSYQFVATSTNTTLRFASQDAGAYGAAIDNIVIVEDLETVPTPTNSPTPTPDQYAVPAECVMNGVTYGAPIVGTNGSNVINGTNGNDLIFALGGSDVVNGKAGHDCIVGGEGSDSLHGQGGNDVILGGDGSDAIQGDEGHDWLYGQDGSDSVKGASGNDHLFGGNGSDSLKGDGGNDNANGGANSDSCNAEVEDISCEV